MKKNMTFGSVMAFMAAAVCSAFGAQQPVGVAGVDVIVKQKPSARAVTDARGNFALGSLAPGSYTLVFKARKAQDVKTQTRDKVTVATSYAIKIQGAKRAIIQSDLTSDALLGGIETKVDVAGGSQLRGQVTAGALRNMVWIPKEPGSNIPGRWVAADSPEAKRAFNTNAYGQSGEGLRRWIQSAGDQNPYGSPSITGPAGNR